MRHSAKTYVWLVPHFTLWRHVLHRHQRRAGCCRGNRGTATSIWHLGKHGQRGEQDGQHWRPRKDTGIKCHFPKSNLPEPVIIAMNHILKTLTKRQPEMPCVTWGRSLGTVARLTVVCLCHRVPIWPLTLEDIWGHPGVWFLKCHVMTSSLHSLRCTTVELLYSVWLFLALLQRLNNNSGGLLIKAFMNCLKSIKHKTVPHIIHFCIKCTQYALALRNDDEWWWHFAVLEVTHSTWHQQCVVTGVLLIKCFYAAENRGLQKTKRGHTLNPVGHHIWFMPYNNSWLGAE